MSSTTKTATRPADTIEVRPLFDGATTCNVFLSGTPVGQVAGDRMYISGRSYRFADQDAAVAAVISNHQRGWWTGEL